MKQHFVRLFAAVIVCTLATVTAFADKIKRVQMTLADDVMVSDTLVKAGTYDFRFNEDTGELSILKAGKVRAKTTARFEQRSEKARRTALRTRVVGEVTEFTGIVFGGSDQELVVTKPSARR